MQLPPAAMLDHVYNFTCFRQSVRGASNIEIVLDAFLGSCESSCARCVCRGDLEGDLRGARGRGRGGRGLDDLRELCIFDFSANTQQFHQPPQPRTKRVIEGGKKGVQDTIW